MGQDRGAQIRHAGRRTIGRYQTAGKLMQPGAEQAVQGLGPNHRVHGGWAPRRTAPWVMPSWCEQQGGELGPVAKLSGRQLPAIGADGNAPAFSHGGCRGVHRPAAVLRHQRPWGAPADSLCPVSRADGARSSSRGRGGAISTARHRGDDPRGRGARAAHITDSRIARRADRQRTGNTDRVGAVAIDITSTRSRTAQAGRGEEGEHAGIRCAGHRGKAGRPGPLDAAGVGEGRLLVALGQKTLRRQAPSGDCSRFSSS